MRSYTAIFHHQLTPTKIFLKRKKNSMKSTDEMRQYDLLIFLFIVLNENQLLVEKCSLNYT